LLKNVPAFCQQIMEVRLDITDATLGESNGLTTLTKTGMNFDNVQPGDWLDITSGSGLNCLFNIDEKNEQACLRRLVQSASGDTITLSSDATGTAGTSDIDFTVWYYPQETNSVVYLPSASRFFVRDNVEINHDGVVREIMSKNGNSFTVLPSYTENIRPLISVCNWKANTNFNLDFSLQSGSPAIDSGLNSGIYDYFYSLYGIDIRKDFNGNARPSGNGWDIGAYEYGSSPGQITCNTDADRTPYGNCDGTLHCDELTSYINGFHQNSVTIQDVTNGIIAWRTGGFVCG